MKMLLLFVMLFTDVYQTFVNRNRPCCKKVQASEKTFICYKRDLKNSLTTKLITSVNFVIIHRKVFLVKLSISKHRREVLWNFSPT